MSKTLVVSYLPSGERSFSKKLLDRFLSQAAGKTEIIHRNLIKTLPPVFDETSLVAYQMRGYGGQTLSGEFAEAIKPFDELIAEIKAADNVVFAFPMHNYSLPGVFKTYIDAILQHGEVFKYNAEGKPEGFLTKTRAAVLYASGGIYDKGHPRNVVFPVLDINLGTMGIAEKTLINASATLYGPEASEAALNKALAEVDALAARWFEQSTAVA